MKIWLLECIISSDIYYGDTYSYIVRGYYLKEEAEEALKFRKQLLHDYTGFYGMRCVEYELSKLGDCGYSRKDMHESSIFNYTIIETEII